MIRSRLWWLSAMALAGIAFALPSRPVLAAPSGARGTPVRGRRRAVGNLQTRVPLLTGKEVTLGELLQQLSRVSGINLAVAGPALNRKVIIRLDTDPSKARGAAGFPVIGGDHGPILLTLKRTDPRVSELLAALEAPLEGKWRRDGEIYVLGPPDEVKEFSDLGLRERMRYAEALWATLEAQLTRKDWVALYKSRESGVAATDLAPGLRQEVRQLAYYGWWARHDSGLIPLRLIREGDFALRFDPQSSYDPAVPVLSVMIPIGGRTFVLERHWMDAGAATH